MCRFILVKSKEKISSKEILTKFTKAVKKSRTPDGDLQEDGWGYCWLDDQDSWQVYKSINSIWEDEKKFSDFPNTKIFLAHARSASFPSQKGFIEFNQPYISGEYAFVFNGLLKGVRLPNVPGKIGAKKIWNLLKEELNSNSPNQALENVRKKLLDSSRDIIALNIGLASKNDIFSLNYFTKFPQYYEMFKARGKGSTIVCSVKIS